MAFGAPIMTASFVALGLHALQHRGQEGAWHHQLRWQAFPLSSRDGHVAAILTGDEIIRMLAGRSAIGHVRYSTAGGPACATSSHCLPSLLKVASRLRKRQSLERLEVAAARLTGAAPFSSRPATPRSIIHLVATSDYTTNPRSPYRCAETGRRGLFAGCALTDDGLIACRDRWASARSSWASLAKRRISLRRRWRST